MKKQLTRIEVLAQYIDENGKRKGGQNFYFYADADVFMYAPKELIYITIQELLDRHARGSYEYISHELVFFEPIELYGNFGKMLQENYDKTQI